MAKKIAKRNPQDATMRNVRAFKKRLERTEERLDMLETAVHANPRMLKVWQAEVRRKP